MNKLASSGKEDGWHSLAQLKSKVGTMSNEVVVFALDDPGATVIPMLGLLIVLVAQLMLWFNEKRAVKHTFLIDSIQQACTKLDPQTTTHKNLFKLVYLTAETSNKDALFDSEFGVAAQDSYRLRRIVEMY